MHSGPSRSIVIGFTILTFPGLWASNARAQQPPAIEIAFPNQLVRGQANIVHLAIPGREMFAGAEVSPAAGVTISRVVNSKKAELSQNVAWWDVTIDVAKDATPGTRSLVLLTANGRSTPVRLMIPDHVPAIANVRVAAAAANARAADVEFTAADDSGDLGDQPYVWFAIACGGEPTVGVVRGKRTGDVVRASIPRPAAKPCDLEVRASDAQKIDSNTLKARIP